MATNRLHLALVMALALGSSGAAFDASAQSGGEDRFRRGERRTAQQTPAPPPPSPEEERQKAMTAVGPVLTTAGLTCTVTDASLKGWDEVQAGGAATRVAVYEAACREGLGYILIAPEAGGATQHFDCIAAGTVAQRRVAQGQPEGVVCTLEANKDRTAQINSLLTRGKVSCRATNARWLGVGAETGMNRYEIACEDGAGYVLDVQPGRTGGAVTAADCIRAEGVNSCELTPRERRLAAVSTLISKTPQACPVANFRFMGSAQNGQSDYLEVACANGAGFVVETDTRQAVRRSIPCAQATNIGGGCTLSTVAAVDYAQRARQAGVQCSATDSRLVGVEANTQREVIELACVGKPEGVVAYVGTAAGAKAEQFDCLQASWRGVACTLSKPEAAYSLIGAALNAKGRDCDVVEVGHKGGAQTAGDVIEVACRTGGGYIVELRPDYTIGRNQSCKVAASVGDRCTLARNRSS